MAAMLRNLRVCLRSLSPSARFLSNKVKVQKNSCSICENKLENFGYKDVLLLRQFLNPVGMLLPRRKTGICPKMQKRVAKAIRRSRATGLLPNFEEKPKVQKVENIKVT